MTSSSNAMPRGRDRTSSEGREMMSHRRLYDEEEWEQQEPLVAHRPPSHVQFVSNSRTRTSSADNEIIPFYDPSQNGGMNGSSSYRQQQQQQNSMWRQQQQAPPPSPQQQLQLHQHHSTQRITWSEPGHPLLSPPRDKAAKNLEYGAVRKTPTPPPAPPRRSSSSKKKKKKSSSSRRRSTEGLPPSPSPRDNNDQLVQIYSKNTTPSPGSAMSPTPQQQNTRPPSPPPPPPPPPPPRSTPRSSILRSKGHRRVHSAAESQITLPLLKQQGGGEEPTKSSNHKRRNSSSGQHHHRRTGSYSSFGRHKRSSSLGGSKHRRSSSDAFRPKHHRRNMSSESGGGGLPPVSPKVGPMSSRPPLSSGNRARSFSGDGGHYASSSPLPLRRTESDLSFTSMASATSVVSDVRRSKLFKGITETGKIMFHAPTDKIFLLTVDADLESGVLYKQNDNLEEFEEYLEDEEFNFLEGCACNCNCDSCEDCYKKQQDLSENRYILTVKDDLYRRVMSEVSDSRTMPCKLFYCGHHEDVNHPSICIAVSIISLVFGLMVYASWIYEW